MDATQTKVLRTEIERAFKGLPSRAKKDVLALIEEHGYIDYTVINDIKFIIEREIGGDRAREMIDRYNFTLWQRGSEFAIRQIHRMGVRVEIPSYLAVVDDETLARLSQMQLDLVKGLGEETKKAVSFQIQDGLLKGEHPTQIARRISDEFDLARPKAVKIARTESTRVFNQAAGDRYQKAGAKKWKWLAANDERTCPDCGVRHGQIYEFGDEQPPAHPNCRCTMVPVFEEIEAAFRTRTRPYT